MTGPTQVDPQLYAAVRDYFDPNASEDVKADAMAEIEANQISLAQLGPDQVGQILTQGIMPADLMGPDAVDAAMHVAHANGMNMSVNLFDDPAPTQAAPAPAPVMEAPAAAPQEFTMPQRQNTPSNSGQASDVATDYGLMDAEAIQERSHTATEVSETEMAQLSDAINQRVAEVMAQNPGISGQELLAEVSQGLALPPNVDPSLVAELTEQAETRNMDVADMMNATPAGASLAQEAGMGQEREGGMLAKLLGGLGAGAALVSGQMESIIAGITNWITPGQDQGAEVSMMELGDLQPMQTPNMAQSRGIGQGMA